MRNHGLKKEMINAVIEQIDMFMATEVHFSFLMASELKALE